MCGICGIHSLTSPDQAPAVLEKMNRALFHRGPDDLGSYRHRSCSMAMRRLSIIDLEGGRQPISNETGDLFVVFNGEIYNYRELRRELSRRGHRFRTESDTEVIVHLFEEKAEETPRFLQGMFAFCIHDRRDDSLFLARDRFGEKPLYYRHRAGDGIAFSSEVRSLLECPEVPRKLDREAFGYYLRTGFIPAPLTLLEDVRVLPPAHWLKWRDGRLESRCYWEVDYRPDRGLDDEATAVEALQQVLVRAVERQAISDVPLGAFLSGGVDSSSVVAMLQETSSRPVQTFTMRFEEAAYDEGEVAEEVARHLGTEHREFVVPNISFDPEDFWRVVEHVGLPFVDSSAIPTFILSREIRGHVKVALSGDGGDEMFAGYDHFRWGRTVRRLQRLPRSIVNPLSRAAGWLSRHPAAVRSGQLRRIHRGLSAASEAHHMLPVSLHTLFEPDELSNLVRCRTTRDVAFGDLPLLTDLPDRAAEWSPLRQLMYFRLKHILNDRMLPKVDRMSMAASLEVRSPMLDVEVAELSMRVPDKHLIRNGVGKHLLRRAMRPKLPRVVFEHPKQGFSIPLHKFQNEKYVTMARDLLEHDDSLRQLLSPDAVGATLNRGLAQQSDRADQSVYRASHQLWALLQFAAWRRRFDVSV